MVAARACAGLVSTAHQLRSEPDNPYLHDNLAVDRAVFEMVAALPLELGTLAMRRAAGTARRARPGAARRAPASLPDLGAVTAIDLSTTSPLLDEGAWTDPARVRAAVRSAAGAAGARTRRSSPTGRPHLHHSRANSLEEPATIHLGRRRPAPPGQPGRSPRGRAG